VSGIFNKQVLTWAFGAVFVAMGVAARLGLWKSWYWRTRSSVYGYAPLGLAFFVYAFRDRAVQELGRNFLWYQGLLVLLLLLGLWWSVRPPAFVKPAWILWVERYPKKVYEAMASAAIDGEAWQPKVASPEAVQAWAKELSSKKHSRRGTVSPSVRRGKS
jgi:hypothetical protein